MMTHSESLFEMAKTLLVGGVNSPVRSFRSVGGTPRFIARAQGAYLWDADGARYVDYVGSWGPAILGHAHPAVAEAVKKAAENGLSFGAPCEAEIALARSVQSAMPHIEKIRFVNSGTEATMSALRLARAATGRKKLIKFNGGYHGHGDSFLVKAGSGAMTLGIPDSAGVLPELAAHTLTAEYNDLTSVDALLLAHGRDVAAIIVEPVAGNMGCIPPQAGFLAGLRERATQSGALLIFDEVMTGFRVGRGGAAIRYGIAPDLSCLGKIIGGGLPVGAYGGRAALMDLVAPLGPVYQAGTLSGNPLAMAAGIATLEALNQPDVYDRLEKSGAALEAGLCEIGKRLKIPLVVQRVGSMFTVFFSAHPIFGASDLPRADAARFAKVFHALLEAGVYFPPSPYEAAFLSLAHETRDLTFTLDAFEKALSAP